jgi:hypothetical protein
MKNMMDSSVVKLQQNQSPVLGRRKGIGSGRERKRFK